MSPAKLVSLNNITDLTLSGKGEFKIFYNRIECSIPIQSECYPPYMEICSDNTFMQQKGEENKKVFMFKNKLELEHLVVRGECKVNEISSSVFSKNIRICTHNSCQITLPKVLIHVKNAEVKTYGESVVTGLNSIIPIVYISSHNNSSVTKLVGCNKTEIKAYDYSHVSCNQQCIDKLVIGACASSNVVNFCVIDELTLNLSGNSKISGTAISSTRIHNSGRSYNENSIKVLNINEPA